MAFGKQFFLNVCLVFLLPFWVLGQHGNVVVEDTLSSVEQSVVENRKKTTYFSQTIHKIGEPSVASFLFTDYTVNSDPTKQKKPFLLNTTIQPIIGIGSKRWYGKRLVHTFQIIPAISIRIFQNDTIRQNDHSLPVRTPSFYAKFNYFVSRIRYWSDSSSRKLYMGASIFHHSNGQDAYEFDTLGTVNTYNGNFSEPVVLELVFGGIHTISKPIAPELKAVKWKSLRWIQMSEKQCMLYWKAGFEWHPNAFTSPKFLKYHLYGRDRINLQLGYIFNPLTRHVVYSKEKHKWVAIEEGYSKREIRRIVLNTSYIVDPVLNFVVPNKLTPDGITTSGLRSIPFTSVKKRLNVELTWYERIGTTNDYAIFMRLAYYGSDPYNIYFQESIYSVRFGIAFGNFSYGEKK